MQNRSTEFDAQTLKVVEPDNENPENEDGENNDDAEQKLYKQIVPPKRGGTMSGVAPWRSMIFAGVGRTILSRREDIGVGTASAETLERVSLVCLSCL